MEKPTTTALPWARVLMERDHMLLLRTAVLLGQDTRYATRTEHGLALTWARNALIEMADRYERLLAIHGVFDESEDE